MAFEEYSVLMSVYYKELASNLRDSIESIWSQSVCPNDFVLVCDGPLTPDLDCVINEMLAKHPNAFQVVRLEHNAGLGHALNVGLSYCKCDLVARMDSDDISRQYRCEKQLELFRCNPEISICSGTVEEFSCSTEIIEARRVLPTTHDEIVRFSYSRNPFNHPCVMYRKSAVESAGGYKDFYLLEDYYLWVRMIQNGSIGYNLQEPLLWMRAGSEMYKRRAGLKYAKSQRSLYKIMKDSGYISSFQYFKSVVSRCVSSLLPNTIRMLVYKHLLRA